MAVGILVPTAIFSCKQDASCDCEEEVSSEHNSGIPSHFPEMDWGEGNEPTAQRFELGRKLFYDPVLSLDSTISCASCHKPELAFTDGERFSKGVHGNMGERNTPTIVNIGYHKEFFWDGGSHTLEMMIQGPTESENEMNLLIPEIIARLQQDTEYVKLAREAYDREMDPFVFTRALGNFMRHIVSGNTRYDDYINGNAAALNEQELLGLELFNSDKLACTKCHGGFDFTDYSYRNIGLYKEYPDTGRARITGDPQDAGKFKVPTLRNIALTAPYMHDGSMETLEEVIRHYEVAGKPGARNKDDEMHPFRLSDEETDALIAFLETLTDSSLLNNTELNAPQ